jgi:hypothetical protein
VGAGASGGGSNGSGPGGAGASGGEPTVTQPETRTADPVIHRPIPEIRWPAAAVMAVVLFAVAFGGWEAFWRSEQFIPSYRNSDSQWAEMRRILDRDLPNTTVFIGSSRTMFDIDMGAWRQETGAGTTVQLALEGSNPMPVLADIATDEDFRGLLVVGITPPLVLMPDMGLRASALDRYYDETPSQWVGQKISYPLERTFASYNFDARLFTVLDRQPWWPERAGLPFQIPEVRKLSNVWRDRETNMWNKVEDDPVYNAIVTGTWQAFLEHLPPPPPEDVARAAFEGLLETVAANVEAIRARGGEVVFIRPPSSDWFREFEQQATPRETVWEPIVGAADAVGIHFEDYPELSDVKTPEWSHISSRDKERWTRALVRILRQRMADRGIDRPEMGT